MRDPGRPTTARQQLPSIRLYGNIKQSRLRIVLSACEMRLRTQRHERSRSQASWRSSTSCPGDGVRTGEPNPGRRRSGGQARCPRGHSREPDSGDEEAQCNPLESPLEGRRCCRRRQHRPAGRCWQAIAAQPYSILVLNKDIVEPHLDVWTEDDIKSRSKQLTEAVISIWPRPAPDAIEE